MRSGTCLCSVSPHSPVQGDLPVPQRGRRCTVFRWLRRSSARLALPGMLEAPKIHPGTHTNRPHRVQDRDTSECTVHIRPGPVVCLTSWRSELLARSGGEPYRRHVIFTGSTDGSVVGVSWKMDEAEVVYRGHTSAVSAIVCDGERLLAGSTDGFLLLWAHGEGQQA